MWTVVEASSGSRVFNRLDPASWPAYKSSGKYGLSMRGPCFHPRLVRNRAHGRLVRAAAALLRCETRRVLCGHDRFTIYRPTHLPSAATGGVDAAVFRYGASPSTSICAVGMWHVWPCVVDPSSSSLHTLTLATTPRTLTLRTGPANVHLDLNPWWYLDGNPDVSEGVETLSYGAPPSTSHQIAAAAAAVLPPPLPLPPAAPAVQSKSQAKKAIRDARRRTEKERERKWAREREDATKADEAAGGGAGAKERDSSKAFQDFVRENNMVSFSSGAGHSRYSLPCTLMPLTPTPPSHRPQVTRLVQGGHHLQAAMNFHDNKSEDGGTVVVPRFHRALRAWTHEHRGALYKPCPWVTFDPPPPSAAAAADPGPGPAGGDTGLGTGDGEEASASAVAHQWLLRRARRVPMREGSVLLWTQTLAHGTRPNASRCAPPLPTPQSPL